MKVLIEHYRKVSIALLGLTTLLYSIALNFAVPWVNEVMGADSPVRDLIVFFLTTTTFYSLLYLLPLRVYEKWGWRLFHAQYNVSGYWNVHVTYQAIEKEKNRPLLPLPFTYESIFRVRQTPFQIQMVEGLSAENEEFTVTSVHLSERGEFTYLYEVNRQVPNDSPFAPSLRGVETASIRKYDWMGRPRFMTGMFYHLALPDIPLYRGTTIYNRISRKEYEKRLAELATKNLKISEDNAPDALHQR